MSSPAHDVLKCACGVCHLKRVESGAEDAYERHLRAATDRVLRRSDDKDEDEDDSAPPLCYKCHKVRAWRGECVECYMAQHSEPWMDAYGRRRFPDTHNIRQGYYMEEEHYARAHRLERERRAAAKVEDAAATKKLFEAVQGVKYDDKCPHGLPFYACMPCSH